MRDSSGLSRGRRVQSIMSADNDQIFQWESITQPSYWGGRAITDTGHKAMDQIAATGANTLTLNPNFFQADKTSSSVRLKLDPTNQWASENDTFAQVNQSILDAK